MIRQPILLFVAAGVAGLLGFVQNAGAQERQLQALYGSVRLTRAQVVVQPNGMPVVVYELQNSSGARLVLPETKIGKTRAFWAGGLQH